MWNWEKIDEAARVLGAKYEARRKWRTRGWVPHKWRLAISRLTKGEITAFEKFDKEADQDTRA